MSMFSVSSELSPGRAVTSVADGAKGSLDTVGDHPYTFPADPNSDSQGNWGEMDQTSPSLRSLMIACGDAAKTIWIDQYGGDGFGLLDSNGNPEPAYHAVAALAA